jgi:hypothetical protein
MTGKRETSLYEAERLPDRVKEAIRGQKLSIRGTSLRVGVPKTVLHRVMNGGVPDLESYLRIKAWLAGEAALLVARARALTEGE